MIPHQRDPVTLAARLIAPFMTTLAAKETAPQRQISWPLPATTVIPYRVTTETARMRQDVVFRVSARLGKIKREELDNASTAVCGNVLRFIRNFEQYIEEIIPDSTKEEVIELLRGFFSDTMNFVHRQALQISALHVLLGGSVFKRGGREASRRRLYTFAPHQSACSRQGRVRNPC
jgi:hypothetical protein